MRCEPLDCHENVTGRGLFTGMTGFVCDLRSGSWLPLEWSAEWCFDRCRPVRFDPQPRVVPVQAAQTRKAPKRPTHKVSCDECYFRVNLLCALELSEPCATFRPNDAQLKPPQQLRFVFRQERRTRAAWAFPSADEQAALHA
jgi:hypothetical protein